MNLPASISVYIDVRRGRKTERLPLEAKTEAETVAETVEQEDEIESETIEQKIKP